MQQRGTAVVTGASSGIGAATALALASEGFDVLACARRTDRLADVAASHERITAWVLDVTDQGSVDALAAHLADADVTTLVANAGGAFDAATIADADLASWQRTYDVNVLGTVRTIQSLLPLLVRSGRGLVVVMGSTAGHVAYEGGGSYAAAKHAEAALAATLRLELCGQPVRVTEIAPGMVRTEEFAVNRFHGDADRAASVYAGVEQPLTAADVADTVAWVATRPSHVNLDQITIRPVAQAAQHKVHRTAG
jgi:NADP-dependent 3-hydroxy acid dehydrogenase YdfG